MSCRSSGRSFSRLYGVSSRPFNSSSRSWQNFEPSWARVVGRSCLGLEGVAAEWIIRGELDELNSACRTNSRTSHHAGDAELGAGLEGGDGEEAHRRKFQ